MSLNKFMHERNPYKKAKPDFQALALKYEKFRKVASTDLKGNVTIDFKKPECLKALTWCLLKENHGLNVEIPLDRLIPTIPLRLNYILWIEDLIHKDSDVTGVDVGTGATCVYPLLGATKNNWSFVATEVDDSSYEFAKLNVERNSLQDKIQLLHVKPRDILQVPLDTLMAPATFDFCMCNPPFFSSNLEAWGLANSRSDDRAEPKSVSTANLSESVFPGGEVEFVRHMIADSLLLRHRIRVYSTMLGKKTSVAILKEDLRRSSITNVGTTEFCQGRTMRWGLAWSFDDSVVFPKSSKNALKATKPQIYQVPSKLQICPEVTYSKEGLTEKLLSLFAELQMEIGPVQKLSSKWQWRITACKNTWSHQRRKRRKQQRNETSCDVNDLSLDAHSPDKKVRRETETVTDADAADVGTDVTPPANGTSDAVTSSSAVGAAMFTTSDNVQIDTAVAEETTKEICESRTRKKRVRDELITATPGESVPEAKRLKVIGNGETIAKTSNPNVSEPTRNLISCHDISTSKIVEASTQSAENVSDVKMTAQDPENIEDVTVSTPDATSVDVTASAQDTKCVSDKAKQCVYISNHRMVAASRIQTQADTGMMAENECLLRCYVTVRKDMAGLVIQLDWIEGVCKESMHQVMQYVQNRIK